MRRFILSPVIRSDSAGDGHFGARRSGGRKHNGIDYLCTPGGFVFAPVDGVVTKLGFPYGDDLSWRYIEIRADDGLYHRLFYVKPLVQVDEIVTAGQIVAEAQDVSKRYPDQGMLAHVHYEIKDKHNNYIDPATV